MCGRIMLIFSCLVLSSAKIHAEGAARVLSSDLKLVVSKAENDTTRKNAAKTAYAPIQIVVKGDPTLLRMIIEATGGQIGTVIDDIATAHISPAALVDLAKHPSITRIEEVSQFCFANDSAAEQTGAIAVRRGQMPLSQAYTGRGVIIGIYDTGINFRHKDFRDPNDPGKSRILSIWDCFVNRCLII